MSAPAHRRRRDIRPTFEDHFPSRRAGHGSTRGRDFCVLAACRGTCAFDKDENIDDWKEERGLPVSVKREHKRRKEREGERVHVTPYRGPEVRLVWSTDRSQRVDRSHSARLREVA